MSHAKYLAKTFQAYYGLEGFFSIGYRVGNVHLFEELSQD